MGIQPRSAVQLTSRSGLNALRTLQDELDEAVAVAYGFSKDDEYWPSYSPSTSRSPTRSAADSPNPGDPATKGLAGTKRTSSRMSRPFACDPQAIPEPRRCGTYSESGQVPEGTNGVGHDASFERGFSSGRVEEAELGALLARGSAKHLCALLARGSAKHLCGARFNGTRA